MTTLRWLVVALLGGAAVAALYLPPPDPGRRVNRYDALDNPLYGAHVAGLRLQRVRWVSSLTPRVVEARRQGHGVAPEGLEGIPVSDGSEIVEAEERIRASWDDDPGVAFGAFWVDRQEGLAWSSGQDWSLESVAGMHDGVPYCLTLTSQPERHLQRRRTDDGDPAGWSGLFGGGSGPVSAPDLFGPCWPVVKHGLPGPEVARWMNGLAASFSLQDGPGDPFEVTRLLALAPERFREEGSWYLSGIRPTQLLGSPRAERCLAGHVEACAGLLLHPASSGLAGSPSNLFVPLDGRALHLVPDRIRFPEFPGVVDSGFLATLEADFGPDAFRRFWRSELPVAEAFEAAFGVTPGRYVMQRGVETYGHIQPGPGVRLGGWVGLVLAVAIGMIVGGLVGGRRSLA